MKRFLLFAILMAAGAGLPAAMLQTASTTPDAERYWGHWRGPYATGASETADPPLEWSETRNIRWKVEIPGRGVASPVVWGDKVFVLTAVPVGVSGPEQHEPRGGVEPRIAHRFIVMALDRRDGSVLWEQVATEAVPHEASHQDNGTWASPPPVTDGERVYAYFESFGIHAFDMDGNKVWGKDLGDKRQRSQFGEGSTPAVYGERIVIVWDHLGGQSLIVVLDKRTGTEIWRQKRVEIDTWATPLVVEVDGRAQVVVPGMERLRGYDLETGEIVWESEELTMNPIPSPVYSDGVMIATSGFRGNDLKAVRLAGARGDITDTESIVWSLDRDTPYVPSPLLYDGILYLLKTNSGILSAFDARTGRPHYRLERLRAVPNVFSSPVAAQGRVYLTGREGTTVVLRHGAEPEVLAENHLDDGFDASAALAGGELYLRGNKYLYCIAEP